MQIVKTLLIFSMFFALSSGTASAEKIALKRDEITSALKLGRHMHGYARLSGMLADLVRTVKNELGGQPALEDQSSVQAAEDLINEAGLPASQGDYDGAYSLLEKAAGILMDMIAKINAER